MKSNSESGNRNASSHMQRSPLLVLDAFAFGLTVIALIILLGNHWVKLQTSSLFDFLVKVFGSISGGVEEVLTGIAATSTFISIGIHVANGDY